MEGGDDELMDLPPGFRFHPTDEEIITNYLIEKVMNTSFTAKAIAEVDLNKCEPWDLPKKAKMGEKEYFFFCKRDRKYPTGMRTNRATESGYWKATGKDKEIFKGKGNLVGMKKTLVFYKGRAPKGEKTNWVMHEFRLEGKFSYYSLPKTKEEWVVSKVFHKMAPKRNSIGELIRIDSFVDHLLDNPSLPALMEMNSADENLFNDSSSPSFNNQKGKMAQYQPYNNNANINYYQASSSNTSAPNPAFYPRHTYQNTEFANQNQETRPGNFPGFNSGPGNFPGYDSGPGFMQMSNQTISQTAIRRDCKMEQFSTNNSLVSHSQDTGLSTDFGPPEISSMVSRPDDNFGPEKAFDNEDLEYLSSGTNIAELDSFWDY